MLCPQSRLSEAVLFPWHPRFVAFQRSLFQICCEIPVTLSDPMRECICDFTSFRYALRVCWLRHFEIALCTAGEGGEGGVGFPLRTCFLNRRVLPMKALMRCFTAGAIVCTVLRTRENKQKKNKKKQHVKTNWQVSGVKRFLLQFLCVHFVFCCWDFFFSSHPKCSAFLRIRVRVFERSYRFFQRLFRFYCLASVGVFFCLSYTMLFFFWKLFCHWRSFSNNVNIDIFFQKIPRVTKIPNMRNISWYTFIPL